MERLVACAALCLSVFIFAALPAGAADALSKPVNTKAVHTMCCSYGCCDCGCVAAKNALARFGFYKAGQGKKCN